MAGSTVESRAWRIAHAGLDLDAAFRAFDELLRAHVPYAIASWSTHDPATGLFTSCTMSGAPKDPAAEARLFRCEFTAGEPSSYRTLIAHHQPGGDPERGGGGRLGQGRPLPDDLRTVRTDR